MKTILRKRVQTTFSKPSRTQQHLKNECDINSILEKYRKTGMISHVRKGSAQYGDFTQIKDFKQNLDMVRDAHLAFDQLPAVLRKRFQNDPTKLVEFLDNPQNLEEAQNLGLVQKPLQQPPQNDDKTTNTEVKTQVAT